MTHTPTPWRISSNYGTSHHVVREHGGIIAMFDNGSYVSSKEEGEANAKFACLAVNSHQAMADALLAAAATVWWAAEKAAEQIGDEAQQVIASQRRAVLAQIEAALALSHKGE